MNVLAGTGDGSSGSKGIQSLQNLRYQLLFCSLYNTGTKPLLVVTHSVRAYKLLFTKTDNEFRLSHETEKLKLEYIRILLSIWKLTDESS